MNIAWFILALLGYLLLAVAFILDKFILTKSVGQPAVYTFYSTIFLFGAVFLFPVVGFAPLFGMDWLWAMVSGLAFGFGMWTLFLGVKKGEASRINPIVGAVVMAATFFLASAFLGESLSPYQLAGVLIMAVASFLLSFEKTKSHSGFHRGFLWAILSGILFAISHVSAKYLYELYPFWSAFLWTRATTGFVGLITLFLPSVRRALRLKRPKNSTPQSIGKRYAISLVIVNKITAMAAVVLIQYAAAIGSITVVFALSGLQYAFMFVCILLLTKFVPSIFQEYYTRRELIIEWFAIVLILLASGLVVF